MKFEELDEQEEFKFFHDLQEAYGAEAGKIHPRQTIEEVKEDWAASIRGAAEGLGLTEKICVPWNRIEYVLEALDPLEKECIVMLEYTNEEFEGADAYILYHHKSLNLSKFCDEEEIEYIVK